MTDMLENYIGSVCELKTMANELVYQGKLTAVLYDPIEMIEVSASDGGRMPLYEIDTPLKINVVNSKLGTLALGGRLYIANDDFWRVREIKLYNNFERRNFFRVNLCANGKAAKDNEEHELEKMLEVVEYPAQLVDISLSGVLFSTEAEFELNDRVRLSEVYLDATNQPFLFFCKIVRVGEKGAQGRMYGCEFVDLDNREADRLCRAVFALQRAAIKRKKGRF